MKEDQIPVKEIVRHYLIEHGYDGLYSENGQCGCSIEPGSFMSCEAAGTELCKPGYRVEDLTGEFEFRIVPEKKVPLDFHGGIG